ncbi:ABC transporter ATP-binding protein [bacterium]|nr:MAG: ABC transporter ATP-binding protein [bacterium]
MSEAAVVVDNLWKYFGASGLLARWAKKVPALQGIDFTLERGELAALVGESGSGKTTLGRCLLGLVPFEEGRVTVNGFDMKALKGREEKKFRMTAQMVFQNPYASLNPAFKVRDALVEAVKTHFPQATRQHAREEVEKLARLVQLPSQRLDEFPTSLSGGEKRRVVFARALATRPSFVVTDEPVSGLDQPIQTQLLDLLRQIHERQKSTMIFISHDLRLVKFLATRVLVLLHGRIVEDAPASSFFREGPGHPYSKELLKSAYDPRPNLTIQNHRKAPERWKTGCSFRHRCQVGGRGNSLCADEIPMLVEVSPGHRIACHLCSPCHE